MQLKLVLENPGGAPEPDHRLVRKILRAIRWFDLLSSGLVASIEDLARAEECCPALISDSHDDRQSQACLPTAAGLGGTAREACRLTLEE
jgi:hypothetical protein